MTWRVWTLSSSPPSSKLMAAAPLLASLEAFNCEIMLAWFKFSHSPSFNMLSAKLRMHPYKYRLKDLCISVSAVDMGTTSPVFLSFSVSSPPGGKQSASAVPWLLHLSHLPLRFEAFACTFVTCPCAPSSPVPSLLGLTGLVLAPPSPLVGGPVYIPQVHTCEICWTASCSPRLTLLWFSRVPASEPLLTFQQALTGFDWVCEYIDSHQSCIMTCADN
ncbi:uncharacterized protein LACBIDRAFT_334008 [Laccaria bicolor S238N-H82]|uniref:Predicted protein n=1 Tax=Laccaria bicolor (strain S238N-H82 / ATCC MYA-4686) TaxID=486041 RepID=B0DXS7_LACBS|nr:uncharacterized protein LACBIDRAFT_334008 [Laccaria bicolor S238N-H82]EDR00517.1 predicted protein [Laccaria bicolor S238N-H82]|eukprot:XP_001888744.1 predicted protein [Laccaria bicolor S238N-H82]